MEDLTIAILFSAFFFIGLIFLFIKLYKPENFERYTKQRMQGPFVPEPNSDKLGKDTYTNTK
jgi:hypothetical protein